MSFSLVLYAICSYFHIIEGFLNIEELQEMRYSLDISQNPLNLAETDFSEGLQLASKHGQQYFCKLPTKALEMEQLQSKEDKIPSDYPISNLLEPLRMQPCLKIVKGWWTYEFCYMKLLHQYHSEDGKPVGDTVDLGQHQSDFDWTNEQSIKEKMFKRKSIQKYHTQYYVNGTECNVIKHKRDTEVRFFCDENAAAAYIERIDEPSTCSYILTVKTNLICNHPHTRLTAKSKPVEIMCQPVLPPDSFRSYFDRKAKAELVAYEEANLAMRKKRDQLRELLLDLKTKTKSDSEKTFSEEEEKKDENTAEKKEIQVESNNREISETREIAIGFLQRFVPEKKFIEYSTKTRTALLEVTIGLVSRYKNILPSADLARLIRFEVLSFVEREDSLSEDFIAAFLRGITPKHEEEGVKHLEKSSIHIKVRQGNTEELDDELSQQDPAIKELEKQIQNELDDAGVTSKRTIEVHLLTSDNKKDYKLTESDIDRFKEALLEIMGGGAVEEREKAKFNRLVDNYSLLYKDADSQFVLTRNNDEDDARS